MQDPNDEATIAENETVVPVVVGLGTAGDFVILAKTGIDTVPFLRRHRRHRSLAHHRGGHHRFQLRSFIRPHLSDNAFRTEGLNNIMQAVLDNEAFPRLRHQVEV
jgi:hypothetical protein